MDNVPIIEKSFGLVPCGEEVRDSFKIENKSKTPQVFVVVVCRKQKWELFHERLQIQPLKTSVEPGKSVRFTLTYISYLENAIDNMSCNIVNYEKVIAHVKIHAQSVGPCLDLTTHNLRFFRFRDVFSTVKHVELVNTTKCEAKFCFDLDEDYETVRISQTKGVIPPGLKLNLKITFSPCEPGLYYRQIFCIMQFHNPVVFNVMGAYKPKLKLDPKRIVFKHPPQTPFSRNYEAYMAKPIAENFHEEKKVAFAEKCAKEYEICLEETSQEESEEGKQFCSQSVGTTSQSKSKSSIDKATVEVGLTTNSLDLGNLREVLNATSLVNLSKSQYFFYQWDHDPKNNFQIEPCNGILEPGKKSNFSVYFTPSSPDLLYHVELDVRVFPYSCVNDAEPPQNVDLPLTMSLKIIGSSFPDDSCGWVPQCTVVPKALQLPSCVPGEVVYGTFIIERRGHLPVTFRVVPSKESNYAVRPNLGFFSTSFQVFVVEFNAKSTKKGVYPEDLKIIFNNSETNFEIIKVSTAVEIPELLIGINNCYTFEPSFPNSRTSAIIPIRNRTTLSLKYEFKVPDDVDWVEVSNPTGLIEPMYYGEVEVIFKPEVPCEYLDYVTCLVWSTSMPEYVETIYLQLIGSCQFGYLIATPSIHDFGQCIYKTEKCLIIHLFNFSPVLLNFRLRTIHRAFPVGDAEKDVKITPDRGSVPGKGCLDVKVTIKPHDIDVLQYAITCQNYENDSEEAQPCEDPRTVFSFRFEGVLPGYRIADVNIDGGGPLFSPHWIWKMMNIERINKSLNSVNPEREIEIKFPEVMKNSFPITIALLIEVNRYGDVAWNCNAEVFCPCPKQVPGSSQTERCPHEKILTIIPQKMKLTARKRVIVQLVLNYDFADECHIHWTINLSYKRKITLNTCLVSLPTEDLSFTSMYLIPKLSLKPVYVGDSKPPLQLFWLYNNTEKPTSYLVDKVTLREATTCVSRIFDCINPNGVLPPFSSVPLAFLFKPNEIMSYSVTVSVCLREGTLTTISLEGEGVPNIQQISELSLGRTIPEKPILYNSKVALENSVNFLNINYLRTFSETKRIFYIQNRSQSEVWAFRWHQFRAQNIFEAFVEPEKGLVEPGQKKPVTLILQSDCYPTLISFSLPCDVINYTTLSKYETSLKTREKMAENFKDYFTITEKGISYEVPKIPIPEKPEPGHLFLTVNANIISELNIDQKLTRNQQMILKGEKELEIVNGGFKCFVQPSVLPSVQEILEKTLWNILNGSLFQEKIKACEDFQDYNYLQILLEGKKQKEEMVARISSTPGKSLIQGFLENTIREIICKNFPNKNLEDTKE